MSQIIKTLQAAVEGLLFPSETDAPLVPFEWPSEESSLTPERVLELAQEPADAQIETVSLDDFFRPATAEQGWHNEEERAEVRRWQQLVQVLNENLREITVYRIGETNIGVYIVGRTEDGYADSGYTGLQTRVVET